MRQDIKHVAVIGAGTIGASWAAYFLSRGLSVTASDPSPGAPDLIRRMVEKSSTIRNLRSLGGIISGFLEATLHQKREYVPMIPRPSHRRRLAAKNALHDEVPGERLQIPGLVRSGMWT